MCEWIWVIEREDGSRYILVTTSTVGVSVSELERKRAEHEQILARHERPVALFKS